MIYKGEKYLYIGYVVRPHGDKGKILARIRRRIAGTKIPHRVFIKVGDKIEEYRVKLVKEFKNNFILRLSKLRGKEDAMNLVSSDVYIKEDDLPRKTKIEIGLLPQTELPEANISARDLEEVGMITRPRGLQGAVALITDKDKMQKIRKGVEVFLGDGGKFFRSEVRAVKRIAELEGGKVYLSIKLLYVNDINSAERLRKVRVFVSSN